MTPNTHYDLIINPNKNLSVEVRLWWLTKSGKYAWVGNTAQPISEAFRVHVSKLRERYQGLEIK